MGEEKIKLAENLEKLKSEEVLGHSEKLKELIVSSGMFERNMVLALYLAVLKVHFSYKL